MTVKIIVRHDEYEVKPGMTIQHAMEKLNLQPEKYLAVLNGELITEDEILKDGQTIHMIAVISGG